jgi:hypothetical protein
VTLHLTPAEGDLAWVLGSDGRSVELTPTLHWEAQFIAPRMTWGYSAVVRFRNSADQACFESRSYSGLHTQTFAGFPYLMDGGDFDLASSPSPCGDDFTIAIAEITVTEATSDDRTLAHARVPCSYRVSRTR